MCPDPTPTAPTRPIRLLRALIAGLWLCGLTAAAASQTVQEIVVTAQRRAAPLQSVAASISRLEPGAMGRLDLGHHAEALNRIPGVWVQRGSGQESLLAIRSPVLTGAGACGAFVMLEDGFPLRPTGFCNVNELFESNTSQAAAIEVVRGPSSSAYGANAVHGTLQVISPTAAALHGVRASLVAGVDGFINVAAELGDGHSGLYGTGRHDNGFRLDSAVTELKLNAVHDTRFAEGELRWRAAATRLDQDTAGFVRGENAYRDPVLRRSNANPEAFRDANSARVSARWTRKVCDDCLDEAGGVLRHSSMDFLQHFLLGKPLEQNSQTSLALNWARERRAESSASFTWRIGADAEWADTSLRQSQSLPTAEGSASARAIRPAGRQYDYNTAVLGAGLHGRVQFEHAAWQWRAGVRFDRIRYRYDNRMRDGNTAEDGTPCPGGCLYSRPADRSDQFDNVAPQFEVLWRHSIDSSLYLLLSEGFRPPEITELYRLQRNQSVAELDREQMQAAEIGWRHARHGSLALFAQRKRNVILRDANGFNVIGGRTRHEGLEYAWRVPIGALTLTASGTYARHRYDFSRQIEGGETIIAGRDIDTAPRHLHQLEALWQLDPRTTLIFDWRHTGRYAADAANTRIQPGHEVLRLRGAWQASPHWRLTAEIDNLADTRYADRADFAQGEWRYFPARGRSGFIGIDWRSR
ncbi:MAG: TonB-dependent receptor [Sinobacteraceae bacterium]|nr:TonB-dependent receptor [Nevskiaceae bacterium]